MDRRGVLFSAAGFSALAASGMAVSAPVSNTASSFTELRTKEGGRLYHRDVGNGRPILFVHAASLNSNMWSYQIAFMVREGFRCVAFDRRGHGRSECPASPFTMDLLADDIADVIKGLNLRDIILVGHSTGANEIVRFVARHGTSRIAKIALLAPTTPFVLKTDDNPYGAPAAYFEQMRSAWERDFPKWVEDHRVPFFTPETSPQMMSWLVSELLQIPLPIALELNRVVVECDLRADLAKIDCPVLILHGDNDMSAPLEITGRRTAAGVSGAVLKVYAGAPHGLFLTHMEQVNRDLLGFARNA